MLGAMLILVGCQLIGELVRRVFSLPVPGPVIGMIFLAAVLIFRGEGKADRETRSDLTSVSNFLIRFMGLLFVPAGVGIISEFKVIETEWLPIVVGVFGSTVLSLAVTGVMMHWLSHRQSPKNDSEGVAGK